MIFIAAEMMRILDSDYFTIEQRAARTWHESPPQCMMQEYIIADDMDEKRSKATILFSGYASIARVGHLCQARAANKASAPILPLAVSCLAKFHFTPSTMLPGMGHGDAKNSCFISRDGRCVAADEFR